MIPLITPHQKTTDNSDYGWASTHQSRTFITYEQVSFHLKQKNQEHNSIVLRKLIKDHYILIGKKAEPNAN